MHNLLSDNVKFITFTITIEDADLVFKKFI